MPYIDKEHRQALTPIGAVAANSGELNYQITVLLNSYLMTKGLTYGNINEIIGVLECAKLELYRRIAVPYEEGKKKSNGDVYYGKLLSKP